MSRYLVRRILQACVLVFVVVSIVFVFIHLIPGDPAAVVLGGMAANPTQAQLDTVRTRLGLNRPLHLQYVQFLKKMLTGELGTSFVTRRKVFSDLARRFPRTLALAVPAGLLAAVVGVPLGIFAARRRGRLLDSLVSILTLVGFSTPAFVIGSLLVLFFAIELRLLPSSGFVSMTAGFSEFVLHAIMPVVTLAIAPTAITMRMTRSAVLEELFLDYVTTARAKGLSEHTVIYGHVVRNSLMPVVTILGLQLGSMFAGAVIVEYIFNWPGVNAFLLEAITNRDYPVIQAVVLLVAVLFIGINLLVDLLYTVLDPRIRYD